MPFAVFFCWMIYIFLHMLAHRKLTHHRKGMMSRTACWVIWRPLRFIWDESGNESWTEDSLVAQEKIRWLKDIQKACDEEALHNCTRSSICKKYTAEMFEWMRNILTSNKVKANTIGSGLYHFCHQKKKNLIFMFTQENINIHTGTCLPHSIHGNACYKKIGGH